MDQQRSLTGVPDCASQPPELEARRVSVLTEEPCGDTQAQRAEVNTRPSPLKARIAALIWGRRRASARREAEKVIAELNTAVHRLGISNSVPRSVHLAVRRVHAGRSVPFRIIKLVVVMYAVMLLWPVLRALGRVSTLLWRKVPDPSTWSYLVEKLQAWTRGSPDYVAGPAMLYVVFIATPIAVVMAVMMYFGPLIAGFVALSGRYPGPLADVATSGLAYRYNLTAVAVQAIVACGDAYGAGNGNRGAQRLRNAGSALREVEGAIWAARRTRGVTPILRWHRRKILHRHAGQVVARLRVAEERLDTDPADALRELATLLLVVAARYSDGRVGALLDEAELVDVAPARDRETLRLMAVAILTVAGAASLSSMGLPDGAMGPAVAAVALCAVGLIYRRRALRMLELLPGPFGRGGQQ